MTRWRLGPLADIQPGMVAQPDSMNAKTALASNLLLALDELLFAFI
jgi:hypothetical protein